MPKQNKADIRLSPRSPLVAAMENFFGALKSECLNRTKFANQSQVQQAVGNYVQFYNFERIDLKNGLTPFEIRSKAA